MSVVILKHEGNVMYFEGDAGDTFRDMAKSAIRILSDKNSRETFKDVLNVMFKTVTPQVSSVVFTGVLLFNGTEVPVTHESDPDVLWEEAKRQMNIASEAYRKSPDGIASMARTEKIKETNQERIDAVMWQLTVLLNEDFPAQERDGLKQPDGDLAREVWRLILMATDAGDTIGIRWDKAEFISLLCGFGYIRNQYAGEAALDTYNMETHRAYIAGQIMDCMSPDSIGLIPPVAGTKIEQHGLHTDVYIP